MENEEVKKKVKGKKKSTEPAEPLTKKQELNNHIVLMRKSVRKGRVHLINKLTKEVKRLKERKGSEKALEKAKRKAERIVEEIHVIKHLKEDRVSIYALKDKKKLEETLQNLQSTTEERSLGRLSHCIAIQHEVRKYRESNVYWELQVPFLLERSKDKRRRINKKLLEREAFKNIKPGKVKSSEDDKNDDEEEVHSADDEEASLQSDASETEEPEIQTEEESSEEPDIEKVQQPKVLKPKPIKKAKVEPKKIKKEPVVVKPKTINNPEKKAAPKIEKSKGSVRVQVLNNLNDLEEKGKKELNVKLDAEDIDEVPKKRPKSSFFVGGEDKVFVKVGPKDPEDHRPRKERRAQQQHNSTAEFKPIFRKGKLVNKGPKRFKTDQPKRSQFFQGDESSSNLTPLGNKSRPIAKSEGPSKDTKLSKPISSAPSEKLHPSWEAKKRQQPALAAFKGKKITFNDDD